MGADGLLVHNCVDVEKESEYNTDEYYKVLIRDEDLEAQLAEITDVLDLPAAHTAKYETFWIGMDVGWTSDPSEILVFAEYLPTAAELKLDKQFKRAIPVQGRTRLKLVTRIQLVRIANPDQVKAIIAVMEHYKPVVFAIDKTGAGLPLFQDVQALVGVAPPEGQAEALEMLKRLKGYNFSEKVLVGIDETVEVEPKRPGATTADHEQVAKEAGMHRSVLEHSTDCLRKLVDEERLMLPWDRDLVAEYQGQTFQYSKASMDAFGRRRRIFSEGKFHALDASRMAAMGQVQYAMEEFVGQKQKQRPVLAQFGD